MKKLLLFYPLLLSGLLSRAQISKGTILLGGDLGISTSSEKVTGTAVTSTKSTGTSFNLNPSVGLAVQNDLVVGINLGVGYFTETNLKQNTYNFGIFMRKYRNLTGRLYFFGETGLQFYYSDYIQDNPGSSPSHMETKASFFNLGFSPGVAYALTRRWQLEIEFPGVIYAQYSHDQANSIYPTPGSPPAQTETRDMTNEFSFNTSLTNSFQLEVGLRYMIGK